MASCLFRKTQIPLASALLVLLLIQCNYIGIESLSPSLCRVSKFPNVRLNRGSRDVNQIIFPMNLRSSFQYVSYKNEDLSYSKSLSNFACYFALSRNNNEESSVKFDYVKSTKEDKNVNLITDFLESIKKMMFIVYTRWWKIKKFIRERIEKYTIYILECENDKYYVGSTTNRKQRFKEHKTERGGSKWTRMHKPKRVLKEYRRVPALYHLGLEAKVTSECMLKYGINNVRGAMFAQPRLYTMDDLDSLTGFLGHYNDLSYNDVREDLRRTLPRSFPENEVNGSLNLKKNKMQKKKRKAKATDRCFKCGELGHFAFECPHDDEKR